jgi:metallo-beta-lactamase class B
MEPVKVFDNLVYIGSQTDSMWAVITSDGIILIDAGYADTIQELSDGLKKLGLQPSQIKHVIVSHAHEDRYAGARYLQDKYATKVVMSKVDWDVLQKSRLPADIKPRRDTVATDGMTLKLGDTTVTLYVTPAHTPGGISTVIPLKDGGRQHVGIVGGGMVPFAGGEGVTYYSTKAESLKAHGDSLKRFRQIAAKHGVDTFLFTNPHYDNGLTKLHAMSFRESGDPHPFVSRNAVERYFTIMSECTDAQLARVVGDANRLSRR